MCERHSITQSRIWRLFFLSVNVPVSRAANEKAVRSTKYLIGYQLRRPDEEIRVIFIFYEIR